MPKVHRSARLQRRALTALAFILAGVVLPLFFLVNETAPNLPHGRGGHLDWTPATGLFAMFSVLPAYCAALLSLAGVSRRQGKAMLWVMIAVSVATIIAFRRGSETMALG